MQLDLVHRSSNRKLHTAVRVNVLSLLPKRCHFFPSCISGTLYSYVSRLIPDYLHNKGKFARVSKNFFLVACREAKQDFSAHLMSPLMDVNGYFRVPANLS